MTDRNLEPTQVLIVGAGPVGLALGIELGLRGIRCLIVEKNDRIGHAPRAKTANVRTCSHLRRWGIVDDLRAQSPFGVDYPSRVSFVTSLAGEIITKFENAFNCAPERNEFFDEHAQWIPQYKLEGVLLNKVKALASVRLAYGVEFLGAQQSADDVTAELRDAATGETITARAQFMVGADGARSAVRNAIGARLIGDYGLSRNYNVVFRSHRIEQANRHPDSIMYWQVNADAPSLIGPMDDGGRWFFMPTGVSSDFSLDNQSAAQMIMKSTGLDIDIDVLSTDEWVASRLIATKYRDGRIFLAGDACHLHPPFGGFGMNMGIGDAVDLGWKLAACLDHWGGPAILDSYEIERRPVHAMVMDEAVKNHSVLSNDLVGVSSDDRDGVRAAMAARIQASKASEFYSLGVVLGYRYAASPLLASDDDAPAFNPRVYEANAAPGCLAPHAWDEEGRSLYRRFGRDFTLLAFGASAQDAQALQDKLAAMAAFPVAVAPISDPGIRDLYDADFALVRPDQHMAWRGGAVDAGFTSVISKASGWA